MNIKKIGAVLATIIISLIRFPLSCIAAVLNRIDMVLIKLNAKLAKVIDSKWWTDGLYWAQESNIRMGRWIEEYFEEIQEDLA